MIKRWASEDLACLDSELGTGHDRGHELLDGAATKLTRAQDVRGVAAELVVKYGRHAASEHRRVAWLHSLPR